MICALLRPRFGSVRSTLPFAASSTCLMLDRLGYARVVGVVLTQGVG